MTLDLAASSTKETFSEAYEYSYDGVVWHDCVGTVIPYTSTTASGYLLVRLKETANELAGNIRKVDLPILASISGYVGLTYNGKDYRISGLPAGEYYYSFTNGETELPKDRRLTVAEGQTVVLEEAAVWRYLALQICETETELASQVRYLVPETAQKAWSVNSAKQMVEAVPEGTSAENLKTYYESLDYHVAVTDANGKLTQKVGTGCVLYLNGDAFTVVVPGDVDGDAAVTYQDQLIMLNHVLTKDVLSGAYLEAGYVRGDSDINIFDVFDALDGASNSGAGQ